MALDLVDELPTLGEVSRDAHSPLFGHGGARTEQQACDDQRCAMTTPGMILPADDPAPAADAQSRRLTRRREPDLFGS